MRRPARARGTLVSRGTLLRLGLLLAGIGTWALGLSQTQRQAIGPYGLLASASPWFIVGLLLLLAGALAELIRPQPRIWLFGLFLAGLIVAIHASVPILYGGTPEYAWVYKHIGVAQEFGRYKRVTDTLNIYQEWPALFALVASISFLGGTSPLSFAAWGPVAFELADALVLLGIFRMLSTDRRVACLAVLLYEGLVAWVGQDYLSPQAFGYLLWLGIVAIVVRWLQFPAPASSRLKLVSRVRAALLAQRPELPTVTPAMRVLALALVAVVYFAIVAAHQLTPYLALFAIGVLALLGTVWRGWLTLLLLAVIAGSYLAPRYGLISQQFGGVFSGGDVFENASGVRGILHRGAEVRTEEVVQLLSACLWLAALGAVALRWRSLGRVAVPAALAFSPFLILVVQSYGGEAIYRVYLFSAPWCALLVAGMTAQLRALWRPLVSSAMCVVALAGGLQGLYGPVGVDAFTPAELAASLWLYAHARPGSLLVLAADDFPGLEVGNYSSYNLQVIPADPQFGESWLDEASLAEVERWLASFGSSSVYVVFSGAMAAYASYFGYPAGYAQLAAAVRSSPRWQVVYQNADAVIYRVTLGLARSARVSSAGLHRVITPGAQGLRPGAPGLDSRPPRPRRVPTWSPRSGPRCARDRQCGCHR
jgi:hypothetical protein